jgi:hypothetical protein
MMLWNVFMKATGPFSTVMWIGGMMYDGRPNGVDYPTYLIRGDFPANLRVMYLFTHNFIFTDSSLPASRQKEDSGLFVRCILPQVAATVQSYWRCAESLITGTLRRRPRNQQSHSVALFTRR